MGRIGRGWKLAKMSLSIVAALYRYATTGKVSEDFEGFVFARPWA